MKRDSIKESRAKDVRFEGKKREKGKGGRREREEAEEEELSYAAQRRGDPN